MKMSEQAVLVTIRMTKWSNRFSHRKLAGEIAEQKKAKHGTIRVALDLTQNRAVRELATLYGQVNNGLIKDLMLPWRPGTHLLPANLIDEFERRWNDAVRKWDLLVKEVEKTYDASVEQAKEELTGLGLLFDESLFPDVEDVVDKYSINKDAYEMLSDPKHVNDLRTDIGQKRADAMKRSIEIRMEKAADDATKYVQERIVKALASLVDGLQRHGTKEEGSDRSSTFRDNTVTKLGEIADVTQHLNVTENSTIHSAIQEIKKDLSDLNPTELRDDEVKRRDVGAKAKKIIKGLEDMYQT